MLGWHLVEEANEVKSSICWEMESLSPLFDKVFPLLEGEAEA